MSRYIIYLIDSVSMKEQQNQFLRIEPLKRITIEQSNAILRNMVSVAKGKSTHGTFDNSRTDLNFEVGKGGVISEVDKTNSIPARIEHLLKSQDVKDPNKGKETPVYRTIANVILGGSKHTMRVISFGKQNIQEGSEADNSSVRRMGGIEHWALDMYTFLCKKYGENCIAAFIVHLDVDTPYANCILIPIVESKKGTKRISWKKKFVGQHDSIMAYKQKLIELHDELAKVNLKYGLLRGESFHTK